MSLDPNARRGRFRCTVEIFVAELGLPHGTEIEDIQFDKEQGAVEARMEYEKYMANQQTRNNEAQSRALAAASDRDVALANLAQKDRQAAQQMMTDLDIAQQQRETDQFLAGVSAHQTQQKLALEARNTAVKEKEAKKAQETGKGW